LSKINYSNNLEYAPLTQQHTQHRCKKEAEVFFQKAWNGVPALAVTLTFKLAGMLKNSSHCIRCSRDNLIKSVGQFRREINFLVYGKTTCNRYKNVRLGFLNAYEGISRDHPHSHILLEIPKHKTAEEMFAIVESSAARTLLVDKQIRIEKTFSNGWQSYILKQKDKLDVTQDIDWENYTPPRVSI